MKQCKVVTKEYPLEDILKTLNYALYSLQHRGQESAGITVSNYKHLFTYKSMGLVSDLFSSNIPKDTEGNIAIGHVRYSTTGASKIENAQPLENLFRLGQIAIAHNGNLTNAEELRYELEEGGATFNATSDTEVIIKLIARKTVSNFIIGQIFRVIETESEREKFNILITPNQLNELVKLIEGNKINMNLAKKTFSRMLETGKSAADFISESDMQEISQSELEEICKEAIKSNSKAVNDYLGGKEKALKAILGNVMRQTKGRGNAQMIEEKLVNLLKNS